MVTMHRTDNWKISVYGREHGVPHFHIEGRDFRCRVSIATLEVIIGGAPPAVLRAAIDWGRGHRRSLADKWLELNR